VGATLEHVEEMAKRGAYIELCALNVFYGDELGRAFEVIGKVGPDRCILSSDAFMEWVPPGPEFFRMLVGRLLVAGVEEEGIRTMIRDNPTTLLGLPPISMESDVSGESDRATGGTDEM
jgi:predicted metal-dependent phosphotriesterase family hydrolase